MTLLPRRRSRSKHAESRYIHAHVLMDPEWNRLRGAYADRAQTDELRTT